MAAPPVSVRRNCCSGVRRLRAHAVRPEKGNARDGPFRRSSVELGGSPFISPSVPASWQCGRYAGCKGIAAVPAARASCGSASPTASRRAVRQPLVTSAWPDRRRPKAPSLEAMAGVVFQNVAKVYPDGTRAVDDLTLAVRDGEFVVIVGPSGSGKTTALRMVAGLEEISEGTISIGDRAVNHLPARDRDIAMVFQSYALYPHLSVFENIAFGLKVKKVPRRVIRRRVQQAAELLDLHDLLGRKPRALSGGQRQRVAMGRAIVREPAMFLMDEPLSNLDAQLRVHTRAEIGWLQRIAGHEPRRRDHSRLER